ncbi:MAG: hypothetical protein Tsb009_03080 [Planctomycetaceae bacterium]
MKSKCTDSRKYRRRTLTGMVVVIAVLAMSAPRTVQAQPAAIKASIQRGVAFLRKELSKQGQGNLQGGAYSLAAYAMIKGGTNPSDPIIQKVVAGVRGKIKKDGTYYQAIYDSGCDLMLLEAASKNKTTYAREMQAIVNHIVKTQSAQGFWNYLGGDKEGDTSVTQYGVLGLWAAARAGIKVPPQTFEKVANWLIGSQFNNGGWSYRRGSPMDTGETLSMTSAGVSSLLVAKLYLFPNQSAVFAQKKKKPKKTGPVENVNLDISEDEKKKKKVKVDYVPQLQYGRLIGSARKGLAWSNNAARGGVVQGEWSMYTAYGIERMAALSEIQNLGGRSWYASGANQLLKMQSKENGSWRGKAGEIPSTAFGVLFLSRATAKILGQEIPEFGSGTLRGNKGLPDNLGDLEEGKDGSLKKRKAPPGTTEDLLQALLSTKSLEVKDVPEKIVEKIQLGSEKERKQWLAPNRRKQLLRMAEHPRPDVRRVAIWALGRTGDLKTLKIIMNALENDPDLDVAIEAKNALCWISRKPQGFGLPTSPLTNLSPKISKERKLQEIKNWREQVVKVWKKWYFSKRPYQERDDLSEIPMPEN